MKTAHIIEISAIILVIILFVIFVPKNKIREAIVILMFKQALTWILGLAAVQLDWLEYPDRILFPDATKTSFSFEYILYPAICVFFVLYYPKNYGWIGRFIYYFIYCSAITIIEILVEHYTTAINYNEEWHWYTTWLTLFITFYVSWKFYLWFFKKKVNGDAFG
ncbi:CBO0543 family protein [Virgibacillus ihumii]|uniref:CBO0543 family protein n=1 Tax=Virgibacillus ihumii TaxID=2686091 RepID=UPI00157C65E6|nr:CBO0543 family protein [Virgibacillus ihumii]